MKKIKGSLAPVVVQDLLIHVTVAAAGGFMGDHKTNHLQKNKQTNVKPNEKRHETKQVI